MRFPAVLAVACLLSVNSAQAQTIREPQTSDVFDDVEETLEQVREISRSARKLLENTTEKPTSDLRGGGASILVKLELNARNPDDGKLLPFSAEEFELFLNTQLELLRSPELLRETQKNSDLASLEWGKNFQDRWGWFADALRIKRCGKSALIRLSIAGDDAEQLAKVLEKFVETYGRHERFRIAEVFRAIAVDGQGQVIDRR